MLLLRVCPGCRGSTDSRSGRGICAHCLALAADAGPLDAIAGVDRAAALFAYDDLVRRMVLSAKNRGRGDVLAQLGKLLAEQAAVMACAELKPTMVPSCGSYQSYGSHENYTSYDAVTWVPASRAGKRRRGFDHGEVLAGAVAARLGVRSRRMLLRRRGHRQAGRGRQERLLGPQVRAPLRCPPRVLLVDDVITTGASMSACALALRRSGTKVVDGLAISWAVPARISTSS